MGIAARFALLLAGALWLSSCGGAGPETGRKDWPPPSPALWQITTPDGSGTGWLLGTVHALPDGLEWRTPTLENALARADVLVVEIADLDEGTAARDAFEAVSRDPTLPPLADRVVPADGPLLEAALAKAGMADDAFAGVKTWAAALMLASALRTYDPANGVDLALIGEADTVIGLENFTEQYARFDQLSPRGQLVLLRSIMEEAGDPVPEARVEAWLTGDLGELERLSQGALLTDAELRDRLLVSRNEAWAGRIAALVAQGRRPLVAVGAGHVLGPEGLPALLEKRGFSISRLQ